ITLNFLRERGLSAVRRYFMIFIACLVWMFMLIGCTSDITKKDGESNHLNGDKASSSKIEFSYEGQTFQIISLFDNVLDYTNKVQKDKDANKEAVYRDSVVDDFMEVTDNDKLGYSKFFSYSSRVDELKDNTTEMSENLDNINKTIKKALINSAKELPGHDLKLFIMPMNPDDYFPIYNMKGISGVASNTGNVIVIQIDPSFSESLLEYAVAHEYSHTVALEDDSQFAETVLDNILLEGKADVFGKMMYPKAEVPWIEPLSEEEMENILDKVEEDLYESELYTDLQNGTSKYPEWSNYKLGYAIMESYLKTEKNVTPIEWTKLSGEEIIQESEYSQLLNQD